MKKKNRILSLVMAINVFSTCVFTSAYAQDTSKQTNDKSLENKSYTRVKPIEGLQITKEVNNAPNFDVQNPEYELSLSAKTKSNIVTSKIPCDIALVLDVSDSMRHNMLDLTKVSEVPKPPKIDGQYYIHTYEGYSRVGYVPYRNLWYYYDKSNVYHSVRYVIDGEKYGSSLDEKGEYIENCEFYTLDHDKDGQSIYKKLSPEYYIKLKNGTIENVYSEYNKNTYEYKWSYYDYNLGEKQYVIPKNGATGDNNEYQFFEKNSETKKIDALKSEASKFVDKVSKESRESNIDVITFTGHVENKTNGFVSLDSQENIEGIKDIINGLKPQNVTATDLGMREAVESIAKVKDDGKKKMVVLFTDGRPESSDGTTEEIIDRALHYGNALKGPRFNAVIYSIGVFDYYTLQESQVQNFMRDIATPRDESVNPPKDYFFNCSDVKELDSIFTQISKETGLSLKNSKIKDYIDPKFIITEESKKKLLSEGAEVTKEIVDGVEYEVVVWTKDINPGAEGVKEKITIKPKDPSVYGDNLPTNIEGISAVYDSSGNNIGSFPLPHVNILNLSEKLNLEKKAIKLYPNNSVDRSYKITLTSWSNLKALEVKDTGVTGYGVGGIKNVTVRDYLDVRFEPTAEFLASIKNDTNVQVAKDSKGNWYIQWKNQKIPYMNLSDAKSKKWSKDIIVKAKDEFIGGNDIPTNISPISGIYKEDFELKQFPLPRVNVPVNLKVKDKENTIFYGDNIPINGVQEDMANIKNPECFLGKSPTGSITYKWFESDWVTPVGDIESIKDFKPDQNIEYRLEVSFNPNSSGENSEKLNGGVKVTNKVVMGTYKVKVLKGNIDVIKNIKREKVWFPHGDPIFNFKLEKLDESNGVTATFYDVVRFEEKDGTNLSEYLSKAISFKGLEKGKYRLSELDALRYDFQENSIDESKPCKGTRDGESIVFYVGCDEGDVLKTNLNNTEGAATFINKKVNEKYFSHTDVVKNTFVLKE